MAGSLHLEGGDEARHHGVHEERHAGEPHPPLRAAAKACDRLGGFARGGQDGAAMDGQLASDGRRLQRSATRDEKRLADTRLQQRERAREGRLRDADQRGALGDAARVDDGGELNEVALVDLHRTSRTSGGRRLPIGAAETWRDTHFFITIWYIVLRSFYQTRGYLGLRSGPRTPMSAPFGRTP